MALNGVTTTSTPTNATDATFRAWGSHFSAQLLAAGWVKTGDSGQIDWATVLTPSTINTAQGYEIWRLNDTLHAMAPIFLKFEFGSGITVPANPGIWFTMGTGSDGAGTLTGPISTRQQVLSTAYAVNALSNFWSASPAHFVVAQWCAGVGVSTANSMMLGFERTKDSTGADTNAGLLVIYKTSAGTQFNQVYWDRTLGTTAATQNTVLSTLMSSGTTAKNGTQVAVSPIFHSNGPFLNPGLNALAYFNADIVAGGAVTFQMYGVSHTYMPIGSSSLTAVSINPTATLPTLMTRYE